MIRSRRVKIIATLGPASSEPGGIRALLDAGADAVRLNASHLQPADIPPLVARAREAEASVGRPVTVLCDLAGPKLRIARDQQPVVLEPGRTTTVGRVDTRAEIRVQGLDPGHESRPDARILLHDGKVALRVTDVGEGVVAAIVERGGEARAGGGVNLPDAETSLPSLTPHDFACLDAGLAAGVDVFALSFVRRAADIEALRAAMAERGTVLPIVAKLEKAQAVAAEALRDILRVADMVMVARGDLGAETAPELVPVLQKRILQAARAAGTPAITATEMLDSMVREDRPTRAEAADVANAVFDGSDALLLTAETAIGAHPALAVATCALIVEEAERHSEYRTRWSRDSTLPEIEEPLADAVAAAAARAASQLGAAAVVCFTTSGRTGRLVARHRPEAPVLVLAPSAAVARAMVLVWGLDPRETEEHPVDHEAVVALAERQALAHGLAVPGDLLVVIHGAPVGSRPPTNLMRVHRIAG